MSEKHKQRKAKLRKERIRKRSLKRQMLARQERKLENELWKIKKEQEPKLVPIRKNRDDNQS